MRDLVHAARCVSAAARNPAAGSAFQSPRVDVAGPILASEVGGPKCKIWGEIGSDLLAGGAGGARLTGTRLGSGPTWPRAEQEAPEWPARRSDTIPVATLRSDRQTPRHTLTAIRFSVRARVRPFLGSRHSRRPESVGFRLFFDSSHCALCAGTHVTPFQVSHLSHHTGHCLTA